MIVFISDFMIVFYDINFVHLKFYSPILSNFLQQNQIEVLKAKN